MPCVGLPSGGPSRPPAFSRARAVCHPPPVPYTPTIDCPGCEQPLLRKPGGRCPNCGTVVSAHVVRVRAREKRIEQVVAVFATIAVLALFLWAGGVGLLEGIAVYAVAGVAVWYWGKGTFWSATLGEERERDEPPGR
jgi:hypothetical protein